MLKLKGAEVGAPRRKVRCVVSMAVAVAVACGAAGCSERESPGAGADTRTLDEVSDDDVEALEVSDAAKDAEVDLEAQGSPDVGLDDASGRPDAVAVEDVADTPEPEVASDVSDGADDPSGALAAPLATELRLMGNGFRRFGSRFSPSLPQPPTLLGPVSAEALSRHPWVR
jgi:hypothetical protein